MRGPYVKALRLLAGRRGIGVRVGGMSIELDPTFATQGWEGFEFESYRTFAEQVGPGDVVYDVGAHIGTYSLLALDASKPDGIVVAYEPDDTAREYLRHHLTRAGLAQRAVIRDVCCGSEQRTATFFHRAGKAEGISGLLPVEGFETKSVRVTTLDAEVSGLGLIPVIVKIDVEGAEMDVLNGAVRTLESHRPRILLSIHPEQLRKIGLDPDIVLFWLRERGYACRVLGRDHEIHVFAEPA